MSKYKTEEGTILDTDKAVASWKEASDWNGNNHISRATGSQWSHETLHQSSKGNFYIESWSDWQGSGSGAAIISRKEAAVWLLHNDEDLPTDLKDLEDEASE